MTLTGPQRRALEVLDRLTDPDGRSVHARAVAEALWPDSPAWGRRPHRRGAAKGAGTAPYGGTMPLKAGSLLGRLAVRGVAVEDDRAWRITDLGRRVLAGTADPLPPPVRAPEPVRTPKPKPTRTMTPRSTHP